MQALERSTAAPAPGGSQRPNIVLVMTDDQALSQTGPAYMPRITALLQDEGTTFENAFLTTPLCCPSRAGLLTGQYGHNNGVLTSSYPYLRRKGNVLPVWLQRAGYTTAHVGKFLNRYHQWDRQAAVAPGWDQWYTELDSSQDTYYDWDLSRNGRRIHYGTAPNDYAPRVFERSAVGLVRRFAPRRRPLFLELDEIAPHPSLHRDRSRVIGTRCGPVPDPRDVGKFADASLPEPPSFNEADVSDKPAFLAHAPRLTEADIRRRTARYRCGLASLQEVDRTVGHLYRELRDLGELDTTVFIFYTDNGIFFGEHRIAAGKLYPYEEADRTPLYIRLPARYRGARVPQVSAPVANIDLAPTILALAHARPCNGHGRCRAIDGRNLLPLLRGRVPDWAPQRPLGVELHLAYANSKHAACVYSGVRVPGQVFVRHTRVGGSRGRCVKDVERERYDLGADPYQLHNLCFGGGSCPDDAEQRALQHLLARIRHCSGVPGRDPKPRSGHYCG